MRKNISSFFTIIVLMLILSPLHVYGVAVSQFEYKNGTLTVSVKKNFQDDSKTQVCKFLLSCYPSGHIKDSKYKKPLESQDSCGTTVSKSFDISNWDSNYYRCFIDVEYNKPNYSGAGYQFYTYERKTTSEGHKDFTHTKKDTKYSDIKKEEYKQSDASTKKDDTSVKKDDTSVKKSTTKTISSYEVLFDSNYLSGLTTCDGRYGETSEARNDGTGSVNCKLTGLGEQDLDFPSLSSSMYHDNYQLLGWSKTNDCANDNIKYYDTEKTARISSNITYYACYKAVVNGDRLVKSGAAYDGGEELQCGSSVYVTNCYKENGVHYCLTDKNRKVYRDKLVNADKLSETECVNVSDDKKIETEIIESPKIEENTKKCPNYDIPNNKRGNVSFSVCYEKQSSKININKILDGVCDTNNGYYPNVETSANICDDDNNYICTKNYYVSCRRKDDRPTMNAVSGVAGSDGRGTIRVTARAIVGNIQSYYVSNKYTIPTKYSEGWINLNGNTFEITDQAGIKYIWVMDTYGNISNTVSAAVIDTTNTSTTVRNIELYDNNGNIQTLTSSVGYYNNTIKDSKYVRLANDLRKDSNILADGFNPFDMEYKLEVSSPTITVYATLTSNDSKYVDGYEPRTVNLSYGINTILIKIQDKEGKTRTYTILVTRNDDRTSDNTLNNIEVSTGKINFNSNVTDYKIEIPKDTKKVNVNATISSDKAVYASEYEPGEVEITGDTTIKLIKVLSETGSSRTYVLTFVKEGTDIVSDESLQIKELYIKGVNLSFEKEISNYSLSVDYSMDSINIYPVLNDNNSYYSIYVKRKGQSDYNLVSSTGVKLDVGENFVEIAVHNNTGEVRYYRLTIIRKEFGLDISNDTSLKELKVLGYDINFNPAVKDYTVKIKQEKSLVITAVPNNNRSEVFIRGNDELTGFSTIRIKVVAENGDALTYSVDIKKDAFNKVIEIASVILGVVIILVSSCIIVIKKKNRQRKEYFEE